MPSHDSEPDPVPAHAPEFRTTHWSVVLAAGDGQAPQQTQALEKVFERRWALTLLEQALTRLSGEQSAAGKQQVFAQLRDCLWGEASGVGYAEMAAALNMTEGALKVTVHRLRLRYRELLREEVAHTVATVQDIDEELRYLVAVVRG